MEPGSPSPLGPSVGPGGLNVAVFSSVAEQVEVCVSTAAGEVRHVLAGRTGDVWHGLLPGMGAGTRYGLRVHGPWDPATGLFCDPDKLLLDPYAPGAEIPRRWPPEALTGSQGDSTGTGLRSVALPIPTPTSQRPGIAWSDTVIYETHVKGLTMEHPGVAAPLRGTFGGVSSPLILDRIQALGVTTLELLPVAAFASEPVLAREGLNQYWGYNPASFFAPHAPYASDGSPEAALIEFVGMVDALHDRGMEVILDIVLNHTAEGPVNGPSICWRGIDNRAYYRHTPEGHYADLTGTGNTFDLSSLPALEVTIAALRHWAALGVDGFRFDLATVLGRTREGAFSGGSGFFERIQADTDLNGLKLIAEPWDVGSDGYRLGHFPEGWREWNDRFRDDTRRFWRSEWDALGGFVRRLAGSRDVFPTARRPPQSSVNYVTAHDGFTLRDLVSYEQKHNDANGEANNDGHHDNLAWNTGHEGPTDDHGVRRLRERRTRSFLASLLLADGVPMLLAGDERGRTQFGNNNAYCQDNEISWMDWARGDDLLEAFVADTVRLRNDRAVKWGWHSPEAFGPSGDRDPTSGGGHCVGILLGSPHLRTSLLLVNGGHLATRIRLPLPEAGGAWERRLDTTDPVMTPLSLRGGEAITVEGFSLQVFLRPSTPGRPSTSPLP